jgi:hypothetical protein
MALELFVLDGTDYTNNIINDTYDVNNNDVEETWTDGNYVEHFEVVRTRLEGRFTLRFRSLASYEAFVADYASKKQADGLCSCKLWSNKTLAHKTGNVKLTFAPVPMQKSNLVMDYHEFNVTVREA